jgi:hypothetical protein
MWAEIKEILKIVAMPFALIVTGYFVQLSLQSDQLKTDRLKLAVGILSDAEAKEPLRSLGVSLLADSLPNDIELDFTLRRSLASGATTLPRSFGGSISFGGGDSGSDGSRGGGPDTGEPTAADWNALNRHVEELNRRLQSDDE